MRAISNFIIRYKVLHIIFWILYLANYIWELCIHGGLSESFLKVFTLCFLTMVIYMICVYVNAYFLLNRFFLKGRYALFLLLSVANVVLFALLSTSTDYLL